MVSLIIFSMYFAGWLTLGDGLPEWLRTINSVCLIICLVGSIILWEIHKSRIDDLEKEVERLKELQNERDD